MRFVDTNVLLYAASSGSGESAKRDAARRILDADDLALSVQVLQEFYVQSTRSTRKERLTHTQAALLIESWVRFPVQQSTVELVRAALETCQRYQVSYWDAAIIEAARSLGCETLLSEDLPAGTDYAGVRVVNPFVA